MDDTFAETELDVIRPSRWGIALLAVGVVGLGASLVGVALGWCGAEYTVLSLSVLAVGGANIARRRGHPLPMKVRVDVRGFALGDRSIPLGAFREGFVIPQAAERPLVVLRRPLRLPLRIRVHDADEGRRLLRALCLDVTQAAARFWAVPRGRAGFGSFVLTLGLALLSMAAASSGDAIDSPAFAWLLPKLGATGLVCALAALLVPMRFVVGAEGVTLRWVGLRRLFRHDEVRSVETFSMPTTGMVGARVVLHGGRTVDIPLGITTLDAERAAIVAERIRQAALDYRARTVEHDVALLDRGGRSRREWLVQLRALGAGANATFRKAPVPRERLFELAENPRVDVLARAAAAVALGTALDEHARERIRAAGTATSQSALRIVIERVASGASDEALEAALAEVEVAEEQA